MAVLRRCPCGETIMRTAQEEGGVVLLGHIIQFPDHLILKCKKCGTDLVLNQSVHPLQQHRNGVILPDRAAPNRR